MGATKRKAGELTWEEWLKQPKRKRSHVIGMLIRFKRKLQLACRRAEGHERMVAERSTRMVWERHRISNDQMVQRAAADPVLQTMWKIERKDVDKDSEKLQKLVRLRKEVVRSQKQRWSAERAAFVQFLHFYEKEPCMVRARYGNALGSIFPVIRNESQTKNAHLWMLADDRDFFWSPPLWGLDFSEAEDWSEESWKKVDEYESKELGRRRPQNCSAVMRHHISWRQEWERPRPFSRFVHLLDLLSNHAWFTQDIDRLVLFYATDPLAILWLDPKRFVEIRACLAHSQRGAGET